MKMKTNQKAEDRILLIKAMIFGLSMSLMAVGILIVITAVFTGIIRS